jgi:hypothetical protein
MRMHLIVILREQEGEGGGSGDPGGSGVAILGGEASAPATQTATTTQAPTTSEWRTALPEDIREHNVIRQVKADDAASALRSIAGQLVNAQKLIGVDKIPAPQENWTPEQRSQWAREHLGLPRTANAG